MKVKYFGVAHNLLDATKRGPELYTKKLGAGGVFAHDAIALKVGLFCRCTCVHVNYDLLFVLHIYYRNQSFCSWLSGCHCNIAVWQPIPSFQSGSF